MNMCFNIVSGMMWYCIGVLTHGIGGELDGEGKGDEEE